MGDRRLLRRPAMSNIDQHVLAQAQQGPARPTASVAPLNAQEVEEPVRVITPPPQDPIVRPLLALPISIPIPTPAPPIFVQQPGPSRPTRTSPRRRAEEPLDEGLRAPKIRVTTPPPATLLSVTVQASSPPPRPRSPVPPPLPPVFSHPHNNLAPPPASLDGFVGFRRLNNSSSSIVTSPPLPILSSSHSIQQQQQQQQPPILSQHPALFATTSNSCNSAGATFGSTTTPGTSLFSSTKPAGGGLFGSTTTQQQQPAQQLSNPQQNALQNLHPLVKAVGNPQLLGNDDDRVIAHLNQVMASLGVGKLPYKDGNQLQFLNAEGNAFEKFVGIGYNKISDRTDDEGVVSLVLKVGIEQLSSDEKKQKVLEVITNILGNQQNLKVEYAPGTQLRPLTESATEICVIVKEGGFVVGACKLAQVLNDTNRLTQLETQLGVDKTKVLPKVGLSKAQKESYLATPPTGIDEKLWRQAVAANPAPNKMLPVVVRGWEALRERQKSQIAERKVFQDALESLADRVEKIEINHARAQVEMEAVRCRHKQISYRLLRVLLAQWITQRYSKQIDTDEDRIEARCDTLLAKLNHHNQLQAWIQTFYNVLETKGDQLRAGAEKTYDMTIEDQQHARTFLTEILYIGERLVQTNQIQMEDLEAIRRTLEGE